MPTKLKIDAAAPLTMSWVLPSAASLGSQVRCKGILNEMRSRLPVQTRKWLSLEGNALALSVPEPLGDQFHAAARTIADALLTVEQLAVIPRELQDILAISTTERHRWLKDGRLPSAGTRTVRLRGRAKKITFHVFDPQHVHEILDRDLVDTWREDDAIAAAEKRSRAAAMRALTRQRKTAPQTPKTNSGLQNSSSLPLEGWEAFEREGLLR